MEQVHVMIMIQSLGVGGAERFVINLINNSDPVRFRFSLVMFGGPTTLLSEIHAPNVVVRNVEKRGKFSRHLIRDLQAIMRELRPDVVHTNLFTADLWGMRAAKKLGIPVITTEHNINNEYGLLRTLLKRWVKDQSDYYVACSESVREYMRSVYRIGKSIKVIPNGIQTAQFAALELPVLREPYRLAMVGRLVPQKGHLVALEALATLYEQYQWELTITGEGSELAQLKDFVEYHGMTDRVAFAPFTTRVAEVLERADFVLMPSRWEGLGVVAMEAMAAGRVLVASETGGLREIIEHKYTGVLCEPGNPESLAEALVWCFEHPPMCESIASSAREYAEKHFSLSVMLEKYEALYLQAAKKSIYAHTAS